MINFLENYDASLSGCIGKISIRRTERKIKERVYLTMEKEGMVKLRVHSVKINETDSSYSMSYRRGLSLISLQWNTKPTRISIHKRLDENIKQHRNLLVSP